MSVTVGAYRLQKANFNGVPSQSCMLEHTGLKMYSVYYAPVLATIGYSTAKTCFLSIKATLVACIPMLLVAQDCTRAQGRETLGQLLVKSCFDALCGSGVRAFLMSLSALEWLRQLLENPAYSDITV